MDKINLERAAWWWVARPHPQSFSPPTTPPPSPSPAEEAGEQARGAGEEHSPPKSAKEQTVLAGELRVPAACSPEPGELQSSASLLPGASGRGVRGGWPGTRGPSARSQARGGRDGSGSLRGTGASSPGPGLLAPTALQAGLEGGRLSQGEHKACLCWESSHQLLGWRQMEGLFWPATCKLLLSWKGRKV